MCLQHQDHFKTQNYDVKRFNFSPVQGISDARNPSIAA
jgi:hypothetical protein